MKNKIDIKIVIIIVVALFFVQHFFTNSEKPVEDVTVIIPEKTGEVKKIVDSIIVDTIWITKTLHGSSSPIKKEIIVDSLYKAKYEDAIKKNDTLAAKNLFLESISLKKDSLTLVNNNDIKIDGKFITRGKLLEYDIKYLIKKDSITYTPKTIYAHPRLSLVYGVEGGFPADPMNHGNPSLTVKVGLQFKKGDIFTLGMNTDRDIMVGYSKTLRLIK